MLADQMRLGKSAQAIRAADKLSAMRILVICPASVKIGWSREFIKWSTYDRKCQIVQGTKAKIDKSAGVIIINYDILWRQAIKDQLLSMDFAVAIIDESHYLGGRNSNRTKAILLQTKTSIPVLSRCVYKWFLTGTPVLSRPRELYPILKSCAPDVMKPYMSYTAFTRHFCAGYWDGFQWVDKGATNTVELNMRLGKNFMLRRLRKDHLDELPPTYQIVPIDIKNKKVSALMEKEFTWDKGDASYQKLQLTDELATVRRELAIEKIPEAIKHINHLLAVEDKLVVFGYHREVFLGLYEKLSAFNPGLLMGGMTDGQKQKSIDDFKDDPSCKLFLGQITAAGQGIDLSVANNILFVETSWVPGEIEQAADRCSGWNQTKKVSAQFMVIQNSLEEHMLRTVIEKKRTVGDIIEQSELFK